MVDFPRCRVASWQDVDTWAETLARAVGAAGRAPETIVGLTRGGWVPARLLADRLGVKRLVSLRAQHWGVTATPDGRASVSEGLSGPVQGQRVLVVDDITDTGESLELALEVVKRGSPSHVDTAAFLHITHSKYVPTFYAEEIPKEQWVWVVFPWNYWEDVASLVARAREVDPSPDGIRKTLRERCGLTIDAATLARAEAIRSEMPH
jgi:hypoxanthine phosphoribosyltransferase